MGISVQTMTRDQQRSVVVEYFRRLDAGADMIDLFADRAEIYFPKWGVARGLAEIQRMWSEVGVLYREIRHFTEYLNFVYGEGVVVVEGLSDGVAGDGTPWVGGQTHAGRWCDVMEIRDGRIERLYIYLDPDYAGVDTDRYPWLSGQAEPAVIGAVTIDEGRARPARLMTDDEREALVLDYFRRLGRGHEVLGLFAPHAEAYYPKWGVAHGAAEVERLLADVAGLHKSISYAPEYLTVVVDGARVAVEGMSSGVTADGAPWRANQTNGGRFVSVFEVRDLLIERCFTYLDPDPADSDAARYPWLRGQTRRTS